MKDDFVERIRETVDEFVRVYTYKTLVEKEDPDLDFYSFLNSREEEGEYGRIRKEIVERAEHSGVECDDIVYESLSENQKERSISLYFCRSENNENEEEKGIDDTITQEQAELLERRVLSSEEIQDYREFGPHLPKKVRERLASWLSYKYYERLDEEEKQLLNKRKIRTYILNIGIIELPNPSQPPLLDFIKKYKKLFQNDSEALLAILKRYTDQLIVRASPEETSNAIKRTKDVTLSLEEELQNDS